MNYKEKFLNPKWQKKRLEILSRDKFTCQICGSTEDTLHIHHKLYEYGKEPWQYDNDLLITLCAGCHELEKERMEIIISDIVFTLKRKFLAGELVDILHYISQLKEKQNG